MSANNLTPLERKRRNSRRNQERNRSIHTDEFYTRVLADSEHTKWCPACKTSKHVSEFGKHRAHAGGFTDRCKACLKAKKIAGKVTPAPAPEGSKRCARCKDVKPLSEFPKDPTVASGIGNRCRLCGTLAIGVSRGWYDLTAADYHAMLKAQGGGCAICGGPSGKSRFIVDHCHLTGKVRGLLCVRCNSGIGMLGDDPTRVEAAARYLRASG